MENTSELSFFDQLFGQRHRGNAAVVVPDHVWDAGFVNGSDHRFALFAVHRKGLLAKNHFPGPGRGNGDFSVGVVWAANVNEVNIFAVDEFSPIGFDGLVAPFIGEFLSLICATGTDGLEDGLILEVEKIVNLAEGIGVGPAHEAITDETNVEFFHRSNERALMRFYGKGISVRSQDGFFLRPSPGGRRRTFPPLPSAVVMVSTRGFRGPESWLREYRSRFAVSSSLRSGTCNHPSRCA